MREDGGVYPLSGYHREDARTTCASLPDDALVARRPGFHLDDGALHFLLSREPSLILDVVGQSVWRAIDGETRVGDLRNRVVGSVDAAVQRLIDLEMCDLLPSSFPTGRRRVVVIEPHMDDAALSVGGTMWQRRNECEFIVLTAAGVSNYTIYYSREREYFDVETVSALRKAESALFVRLLGGRHIALERLEAPLRYRNDGWTLSWFRQHRQIIDAFVHHSPEPSEHEEWSSLIAEAVAHLHPQEVWMPLGVGNHADHELLRRACVDLLLGKPSLLPQCVLRLYQDVPYAERYPLHTGLIVSALREAGAQLEGERADTTGAMPAKMRLLSIFRSQFGMDHFGPRVEQCAKVAGAPMWDYGELLYRVVSPPTSEVDPISCHVERDAIHELAQRVGPWLRRNRSTSLIRMFLLAPAGRWADDMAFLLHVFPHARLEAHVERSCLPETETNSSPRMVIRSVEEQWRFWLLHSICATLMGPGPLVVISGQGREEAARTLSSCNVGSDSIVAASLDHLILALRQAHSQDSHSL